MMEISPVIFLIKHLLARRIAYRDLNIKQQDFGTHFHSPGAFAVMPSSICLDSLWHFFANALHKAAEENHPR